LKLVQVSESHKKIFEALGRSGCPEICVSIQTPTNQWRGFSDIYYQLVAQKRMPWATYAKLTNYLIEKGFIEKKTEPVKGRDAIFLKLTDLGQKLVSTYLKAQDKSLADLKP
jgi:DNA-binding MarR family transcriptional regulator